MGGDDRQRGYGPYVGDPSVTRVEYRPRLCCPFDGCMRAVVAFRRMWLAWRGRTTVGSFSLISNRVRSPIRLVQMAHWHFRTIGLRAKKTQSPAACSLSLPASPVRSRRGVDPAGSGGTSG